MTKDEVEKLISEIRNFGFEVTPAAIAQAAASLIASR
jgi:hypothetical protein